MSQNLTLEVGGQELAVRRFVVQEALSRPFEVTAWIRVGDANLDLEEIVGGPATFTIRMARHERSWYGVVRHAEQVRPETTGESAYLFRVVDGLWLATQVRGHRVFQHQTLPDIIDEVLEPYLIKPKRELAAVHAPHEYIVQYDETDFAFISRLLERAGIAYFYRFGDGDHELVFSDTVHQNPKRPGQPVHYVDSPNFESRQDFVTRVRLAHRACPGKVTIRDFDFRRKLDFPLAVDIEARTDPEQAYEQYFYAPGSFLIEKGGTGSTTADDQGVARHEEGEGQAKAGRWLQTARRQKRTVSFGTNALDLAPGVVFSFANHPHPELDEKKDILVTEFSLSGTPTGQWLFQGEATFTEDGYQPAHETPRPQMAGVQSAVVVGPPGKEEIYTDEYGRVRVQFHWDREGKGISEGQPSSTWMRVSQPWAGSGFGAIAIPRIGHEVLVRYFEGDPDHPAVVGRVYNKLQPVPYPLPKHKEKSLFKTDSTPHEDGAYNELRLDDRADHELYYLQAELDRQQLVRRHETERTGDNRVAVVGHSRSAVVGKSDATLVGEQYSVQMMKPPSEEDLKVLPQKMPTLEPQPTKIEMVDEKVLATTSSATAEMNDDEVILEAKGEISLHAKGGSVIVQGGPKIKINC